MFRKLKFDRAFYQSFFAVVVPITIQGLISAAVGVADTLMLGFVSQTALAASSLAGQVQYVLNMLFFGLNAGITILCAQYWGKKDMKSVEKVMAIGLKVSVAVASIFFVGAVFFPQFVMRIYTNDPGMIAAGAEYLSIVGWSYLFMAITQPYLSAMKTVGQVKASTVINSTALVLNIILNAVFIFGLFGAPELGIAGVALATVISRVVELILCIVAGERFKELKLRFGLLFLHSKVLFRDFIRYSLPAIGNDVAWGLAFSMYSVIMGHLGEDIVAANTVVSTMKNLASVVGFGVANGTAILLGNTIGSGDMKRAEKDARRLLILAFLTGLIASVLMLVSYPVVINVMELTPLATEYLFKMVLISAVYVIGPIMNTTWICGVFRAGGDSKFGLILDIVEMWGIFVPIGFIAAFLLKLPPMWVYFILCLDEFAKMPVVYIHYKKKGWLRNITKENV